MVRHRKGAGGSADCFSLAFRCRWPGSSRGLGTSLFDSAFVAVGHRCGSEGMAGGAHPRVASLGLRPIHLQPLPYGFQESLFGLDRGVLGPPADPLGPGGTVCRPYGIFSAFQKRHVQEAAPYGPAPAVTCSAEPGAVVESQQRQFLHTQGPVARNKPVKATQILRAGNTTHLCRYVSPVMGVPGGGTANMDTECPS